MKPLSPTLVTLVALLCGSLSSWSNLGNVGAADLQHFAIAIKNRKVEPAHKLIRVTRGDVIELEFTTDEPAELHLHG